MANEWKHTLDREQMTVFIEPNRKDIGVKKNKNCLFRVLLAAALVIVVTLAVALGVVHYLNKPAAAPVVPNSEPSHVVFILVDDLGFNDVSWNNPDVKMPNLEAMAREGIILDQNYVQPVGSPSRGSIMTGMYAYHIGMQHDVLMPNAPECASRDHTFLPEKLREYGYATHLLGKWHLGFCNLECTPTYRGFDTFYGFYQNRGDHYNHTLQGGYDWRDGTDIDWSAQGQYSTDLITNRAIELINHHDTDDPMFLYLSYAAVHTPLQAPERFMNMHKDVTNQYRRPFLAMISALDESVGLIMDSLRGRNMMENTLVIFTSDNGGQMYLGSNQPLRGAKSSIYEGGTRVPGFVYGHRVSRQGEINNGMVHASDWFPTLVAMAGGSTEDMNLDGIDQQELLIGSGLSNRNEFIYNIDIYPMPMFGAFGIRKGDFKLILGFPGIVDGWEQDGSLGFTHEVDVITNGAQNQLRHKQEHHTRRKRDTFAPDPHAIRNYTYALGNYAQLYNIRVDPSERVNLASRHPEIVDDLRVRLAEYMKTTYHIHLQSQQPDPAGNAVNFGGVWSPGWC